MLDVCYFILGLTGVVLLFYFLLELNYFLRSLLCAINARFIKKKKHILDNTNVTGICLSNDVDYLLDHMNNARYLRELDFAKIDFYERAGLYRKIVAKGGGIFASATSIRYRRFIKVFSKYRINTKIIYWDNQNIYIEHRFITSSDNFVNAIAMCKLRVVNVDVEEMMKELLEIFPKNVDVENAKKEKPEMPAELEKWNESNQISSDKLRQKDEVKGAEKV